MAAVIIGGIFLLTPSHLGPEAPEEVLSVYDLRQNYENFLNEEVRVEGVLEDGGPPPGGLWLTERVGEDLVCIILTDYEFPKTFFMSHIRVQGIVKPISEFHDFRISVEDAKYVSESPENYPVIR